MSGSFRSLRRRTDWLKIGAVLQQANISGVSMITRAGLAATFIIGVLALSLTASVAQQRATVPRIGFLTAFSASDVPLWREGFRQGLRDLGYTEGQNIVVEYRYADGHPERLPRLATELVKLKVDVIAAETTPANLAVKQATTTIPVVMTLVADPVGSGLVSSLARPGGNVTGLSLQLPDLAAKRLQLLKEAVPGITRVAVLWNASSPITPPQLKAAEAAAPALGLQLESLGVRAQDDFERAFQAATRRRAGALFILDDFFLTSHLTRIAALTARARLPALAGVTGFAEAGVLISYGPNFAEITRRSVTYVDKILKGAKPGELPIEQPTALELVINAKTAESLGLVMPSSLLVRADRIIQ
jgi:putative ABC transport system substrate-binding protein